MRFFLAVAFALTIAACAGYSKKQPCAISIGNATWQMEIAKSEAEREKGLMFRKSMPQNNGMIFVFSTPHEVAMWMKNTYIPLDMLFLDEDLTVMGTIEGTMPLSEDVLRGPGVVAYVLELNAGQVAANNLKKGDKVDPAQCQAIVAKKE
jgi:uncharacterized membrane protein (UPF0127 family)